MECKRYLKVPKFINIEITTACNLNCPQCYNHSAPKEIDRTLLMNYLEEIAEMGVKNVGLTGGEPLLCSYLEDIIEKIDELGMHAALATSGSGLTKERLDQLIAKGLNYMIISLNGSTREIHERSREGYQYGINGMELLSAGPMPFGINWVARKDNIDDFPNVIKLAEKYGAKKISVLRLKPDSNDETDRTLDREHLFQLAEYIKTCQNHKVEVSVSECFSMLRNLVYDKQENALKAGCRAGRKYMAIDVDGNLKPCRLMNYKAKDTSVYDYWNNSKLLETLRTVEDHIEKPCKDCNKLAHCRTCRVICNKHEGGFYAGEEDCPIFTKKLGPNDANKKFYRLQKA